MRDKVLDAFGEREGSSQAQGYFFKCSADYPTMSIRDQPVVFDHVWCDLLKSCWQLDVLFQQKVVNLVCITFQ